MGETQAGAIATVAATPTAVGPDVSAQATELPHRKLGKTGAEVTLVNFGTLLVSGLDRLLRLGYARGIPGDRLKRT